MKTDVDKMHAYRDALRDRDGRHVLRFAATLYPSADCTYDGGLAALCAYSGREDALDRSLGPILDAAFT